MCVIIYKHFIFSRANALRRIHEATRADHPDRQRDLIEAARLLKYSLIDLETPVKYLKGEFINVFKELNYTIERGLVFKDYEEEFISVFKSLSKILSMIEQDTQVIDSSHEEKSAKENTELSDRLLVSIYSVKPTYSYARDSEGNEYFVPHSSFNTREVIKPRIGQKISIWGFQQNEERDGAKKANHASF